MENKYLTPILTFATATVILSNYNNTALANPNEQPVTKTYSTSGMVTVQSLNVRSNPSTSSTIIGNLSYNTRVNILEIKNGWYKINYNNRIGWISSDYVKLDVPSNDFGLVNIASLNVRSGSGTNFSIIGSLKITDEVEILEKLDGWYKIIYNNGVGYVSSEYITITQRPDRGDEDLDTPSPTPCNKDGIVNAQGLNFRKGPSTNDEVICVLPYETNVSIIGELGDWYQIKYNNFTGFVAKDHITINNGTTNPPVDPSPVDPTVKGKIAVVNSDTLNIRSGPGTNYSIVGTARYGNKMPISSYSNGWYSITLNDITGYVSGDYVTIINEDTLTPPVVKETPIIVSPYSGNQIVSEAEKYLGVPYLWGGFTPLGFDCSGLVQYVYKQFGITLERTTYYQVHQGKTINRNELQPGDLIFFSAEPNNPNDISHVGIYKGNDLFIHAPKPGDYVRVSNLNSAFYDSRYFVSKRIVATK